MIFIQKHWLLHNQIGALNISGTFISVMVSWLDLNFLLIICIVRTYEGNTDLAWLIKLK